MNRHGSTQHYLGARDARADARDAVPPGSTGDPAGETTRPRFTRLVPVDEGGDDPRYASLTAKLAAAMTYQRRPDADDQPDSGVPAGYTYLGQMAAHDLSMDLTGSAVGTPVTVERLRQGRSPVLDLDSLYGPGPSRPGGSRFYHDDGLRLRMGRTAGGERMPILEGFDLPRRPASPDQPGTALIPDHRDDENLAVAQIHLAFARFHNRVAGALAGRGAAGDALFEEAREQVVKHYQWLLRHDYLPRIVDPAVVDDVFANGRRVVAPPGTPAYDDPPAMPVEFSVAAFRAGHSMARARYEWNGVFNSDGPMNAHATLTKLFRFSGTSGELTEADPLPTEWIPDFRRLFDLVNDAAAGPALAPPGGAPNFAKRIDTLLAHPLSRLRPATIDHRPGEAIDPIMRNLAYRSLRLAGAVRLAGGQRAADFVGKHVPVERLTAEQIIEGDGGADLGRLTPDEKELLVTDTPLWFYVLREAECGGGLLRGVGARIVAEVFHHAMERSRHSIVREPSWRPSLGRSPGTFTMPHLLLYAFDEQATLLSPVP